MGAGWARHAMCESALSPTLRALHTCMPYFNYRYSTTQLLFPCKRSHKDFFVVLRSGLRSGHVTGTSVVGQPNGLENVPSKRRAQKERSLFLPHRAAAICHPYAPCFWAAVWGTSPALPNKTPHSRVRRNLNAVACVRSPACSGCSPLTRTLQLLHALCYTRHIHHSKERDTALHVRPAELGMSHRPNPCLHPTYHTQKTGDMAALSCGVAVLAMPPKTHMIISTSISLGNAEWKRQPQCCVT